MQERSFHVRGFFSLLSFGSFIVMTLNGIVLYFAPQGQIAYWVDWRFLALTREEWSNMHVVSSILFAVAGVIHLIYNWTPIVNYISKKISGARKLRRELVVAAALSLFVVFGPVFQVLPLNYVIDLSSYFKESWIVSKDYRPPFGHAEQVSLKTFAKRMNIDFEKAMTELGEQKIKVESGDDSLERIAKANHTSPMGIYALIKKYEQKEEQPASAQKKVPYTPQMVEEKFAEMGVGRMTLAEVCQVAGVDIDQARENLKRHRVEMQNEDTLKEAATQRGVNPHDLLKAALIEDYKLP